MLSGMKNFWQRNHGRLMRAMDSITSLSYQTLFLIWIGLALGFGVVYFLLEYLPGHGPEALEGMNTMQRLANTLYFSVITATSTGYGDVTPNGFSKFLAAIQSMSALFVFAVFVTKLVSHRQDIALKQIHKLSFEDMFHNIREGFYIVRKDLDRIMILANEKHAISEDEWFDLTTAYRQAQSYLRRIPDFYDEKNRLYTIDDKREELLQEGVHRTMYRVDRLISMLGSKHVDWIAQKECVSELHQLLETCNGIVHFWRKQSPHHRLKDFEELLDLIEEIQKMIDRGVHKHE
ncbi:two pore domain potassium channel family protein [Candidatus Peribacteria bacterium]|jgi:hypothetical protein|nr:two pore domain potassium channel family protein [Candidatus Peribacteria bacterium]MBT4020754.1 two pore domain potassium channel family protein [Candidatus Peribacteria bacterium]MBT4241035.1 two pore domain potassium channel family protein [Candidatus Peribacteria bacterium]MBT4474467.1 two pore domain potassium channel family protein [Candidatus Peribacteria bacterium]